MVIKKMSFSLRIIFFEYLFAMALVLVLAFLVPYSFFSLGFFNGLYTFANSSEVQAKNMAPKIAAAKPFDASLIPPSCTYVYVSKSYAVIKSSMSAEEQQNAVLFAKDKYSPKMIDDSYLIIKRGDGACILHYYIRSRYTVPWMDKYLPNADVIMVAISIFNVIAGCFALTTLFSRRLKKQLRPLTEATQKIGGHDLDFEVQPCKIKEFNDTLLSISGMKSELKASLERQWRMEQTKKEQTSALAHDIKTPLTVIRGNAELLRDEGLNEKQQKYTGYILKNADRMEKYLRMLIDLTRAEEGYCLRPEKIDTAVFLNELKDQAEGIAAAKQQKISLETKNPPKFFSADRILLWRAVMNVVSNAADFSPEKGKIGITAEGKKGSILFSVTDCGQGFSVEDLKNATSQFYMGDKSRGLKTHYGIGLYITETIVKLHGGTLRIENCTKKGGGKVTIEIPA